MSTDSPIWSLALTAGLALSLGAACDNYFRDQVEDKIPTIPDAFTQGDGQSSGIFQTGAGLGDLCGYTDAGQIGCRTGLTCINDACTATGSTVEGNDCILTDECGDSLVCGSLGSCEPEGAGPAGAPCALTEDCARGLACQYIGPVGTCSAAGTGDLQAPCTSVLDCLAGLFCGPDQTCQTGDPFLGYTDWAGVVCPSAGSASSPARVYFDIDPPDGTPFFHLPHPNDIRAQTTNVDLSGFPTPGTGRVGVDVVDRLIDAAADHQQGFGRTPVVRFRLSSGVDIHSLRGKADGDKPVSLKFVNIDPDSIAYGAPHGYTWSTDVGGGSYICSRWLSLRASSASPLRPNTTYAVLINDEAFDIDGDPLEADEDLKTMLSDVQPASGSSLGEAWQKYALLRAYLDDKAVCQVDAEDQPITDCDDPLQKGDTVCCPVKPPRDWVRGATIFTTSGGAEDLPLLRSAVRKAIDATGPDAVLCDGINPSPCANPLQEEGRGCPVPNDDYLELHMELPLPRVQTGTPPWIHPADGGALARDSDGAPTTNGTDNVCVSLGIPKGVTMPDGGWPVVLGAHDTGANFRTALQALGGILWDPSHDDGPAPVVIISWDQPLHGSRGDTDHAALARTHALGNPAAIRGHLLQGAADIFSMIAHLEALQWTSAESPTGAALQLNPARTVLYGHGRGAASGLLAIPAEPAVPFVILAGTGAGLTHLLANQTGPIDTGAGLALSLGEFGSKETKSLKAHHPALALLRDYLSPVDPIHHARGLLYELKAEAQPRHILLFEGIHNPQVPASAARALVTHLNLTHVPPAHEEVSDLEVADADLSANAGTQAHPVTTAFVQAYTKDGDGHVAHLEDPAARWKLDTAIRTWAQGGVPTVPIGGP